MNNNKFFRIGDTERQQAFRLLDEHQSAGRIHLSEYDERVQRIVNATTQADIDAVFEDLPPLAKSGRRRRLVMASIGMASLALVGALVIVVVDRTGPTVQPPTVIARTSVPAVPQTSSVPTSVIPTTTKTASSSSATSTVVPASNPPMNSDRYVMDFEKLENNRYLHFDTGTAKVSGTPYIRSVMLDPRGKELSFVEYDLGRKYVRLQGVLGVRDDATPSDVVMKFRILADNVPVLDTTVALGATAPIDLGVVNALRLRLEVTNLKPGGDAYGVFGDLRVTSN
ncbi:DUF1707 domain-containing protein [Nocardia brasiliensis]|uniref:DUF1707 domain-containing protein n=1 Tax=Nocardia brasiliensis TaxID=37326 RepID=UPI003D8C06EE